MKNNDHSTIGSRDLFLIRIPKNASRSMADALGLRRAGSHHSWTMLKEHYPQFEAGISIACVRNPYERLVSWYEFHVGKTHNVTCYDGSGIDAFRKWVLDGFPQSFWMGHWSSHPFEQWRWICDQNRAIQANIVLRHENLSDDWKQWVSDRFGIGELPKLNTTSHTDWRDYYNRETASRATTLIWNDLQLLGYEEFCP